MVWYACLLAGFMWLENPEYGRNSFNFFWVMGFRFCHVCMWLDGVQLSYQATQSCSDRNFDVYELRLNSGKMKRNHSKKPRNQLKKKSFVACMEIFKKMSLQTPQISLYATMAQSIGRFDQFYPFLTYYFLLVYFHVISVQNTHDFLRWNLWFYNFWGIYDVDLDFLIKFWIFHSKFLKFSIWGRVCFNSSYINGLFRV